MSGDTDKLAHIEDKATRLRLKAGMLGRRDKHADDVLALVEITKAARELTSQPFGLLTARDFYRLRETLSALDGAA